MEALVVLMVVTIGHTSRSCSIYCKSLSPNQNELELPYCDCSSLPLQRQSLQNLFTNPDTRYDATIPKHDKAIKDNFVSEFYIFNTTHKRQRRSSQRFSPDVLQNNDTKNINIARLSSNSSLKSIKIQDKGKATKKKDDLIRFNNDILSKTEHVFKSEYTNLFGKPQINKKNLLECIRKHFITENNKIMYASESNKIKSFKPLSESELVQKINARCNPTLNFFNRNVEDVEENYSKSNIHSINNANRYNKKIAKLKFTYNISSEFVVAIESSFPITSKEEQLYPIPSKANFQNVVASESELLTTPKPSTTFTNNYTNIRTHLMPTNKKLLKQVTSIDLRSAKGDEISTPTISSYTEKPLALTNNSKSAANTLQSQNNRNNTAHIQIVKPSKTLQRNGKVRISIKQLTTKKPFKISTKDLFTKKLTSYKAVNSREKNLNSTCRPNPLSQSSLINSTDKNVISDDLSLKYTNRTLFSCGKEQRKRYNESEIPIIRIISREFPNDTVSSTIDGTEVIPNDDFKYEAYDITTVKYSDTQLKEHEIYQSNSANISTIEDLLTGNLYFIHNKKQIPARFSQEADGKIRIGLDLTKICQNIISQQSKSLLSILCKCIQL